MDKIIELLYNYTNKNMTLAQLRQTAEIEDDFLLTAFLASAYNCYIITHHGERNNLITNIDALKISENEFQIFLQDFRAYVMDTIKTKDFENERKKDLLKDKENGQND